jgi:hypothetical protein
MNRLTGNRTDMLNFTERGITNIENNTPPVQQAMQQAFPGRTPQEIEDLRQEMLRQYKAVHYDEDGSALVPHSDWYASRQPLMGNLQSEINDELNTNQVTTGLVCPVGEDYGPADIRWAECLIDAFKTLKDGKADFVQHTNLSDFYHQIGDNARIVLVSDWGADNASARSVADQIRKLKPDYVIHLGDIYYAGQDNEADKFLELWPGPDPGNIIPTRNFALNGNHEMFSGAQAYFKKVLPAFGQKASYFGLYNTYWQFLGFDSAYIDHRLLPPPATDDGRLLSQWNWLVDKVKNNPNHLKSVLLSHHQPFSSDQNENDSCQDMLSDFKTFLAAVAPQSVYGWFFGHEHVCTIYNDRPLDGLSLKARLIGNGCIPHLPPDNGPADDGCASFAFKNRRVRAGTGDAISGFVLLTCNGPRIDISYINEDGTPASDGPPSAPIPFDESWT